MSAEYRLVVFKGLVTFIFVGVIGFIIENLYSTSQAKRDRERLLLEVSYRHLADFGSSLSYLRATVSRLPSDQAPTKENLKDYRTAFRGFSEAKVPFVIGMGQLGIGDEKLTSTFGLLNESAIKLDRCLIGRKGEDCKFREDFVTFVALSTEFEKEMISALASKGKRRASQWF